MEKTYKELYEQALERCRKLHKEAETNGYTTDMEDYEEIFPELRESEDEKIRKELIFFLEQEIPQCSIQEHADKLKQFIAYLKKQGEHNILDDILEDAVIDSNEDGLITDTIKQSKQKPADKVKPKFNVGDWVMLDRPVFITKVEDMPYNTHQYWTSDGTWFGDATKAKLWTIQDAKNGDVLMYEGYYNSIVLFKGIGINGEGRINYHAKCDLGNYSFNIQGDVACMGTVESSASYYHPATKEQRDLLFQKMKEAGYEWDAEKKELKKNLTNFFNGVYEREKPELQKFDKWREEDELHIRELESLVKEVWAIAEHENDKGTIRKMRDLSFFLKTLKPQIKQELTEKDMEMIGNIRRIIEQYAFSQSAVDVNGELCEKEYIDADNWIKSLKEKVQIHHEWSDEEMKAL